MFIRDARGEKAFLGLVCASAENPQYFANSRSLVFCRTAALYSLLPRAKGSYLAGPKTEYSSGHSGGAVKHGVVDWLVDTYAVPQFRC